MKGQKRASKGPVHPDTHFTDDEMRRLKEYAEAHGLKDAEEAHQVLSRAELVRRYRVTKKAGVVVPFKAPNGLTGDRNG